MGAMRMRTVHRARRFLLLLILAAVVIGLAAAWGPEPIALSRLLAPFFPLTGHHVGVVAGHSDSDAGAVCPDGLTEAQVNMTIAQAVVAGLQSRGAVADLLAEFDSRLPDYQADAFVSIHADSCQVELSGFKVAALDPGAGGGDAAAERLVACLWREYERATGLPRHPNTVTFDMTRYHAFREIAATTPAVIIEVGFLKADRELLTQRPAQAAAGVVAGIVCFITQNERGAP